MAEAPMAYVTSYENPDSDGICSAIGYCFLREQTDKKRYMPFFVGAMGKESAFILQQAGHPAPHFGARLPRGASVVLVDTHNLAQLPPGTEPSAVEEVVDHHPDGDPSAFPNAIVQNEAVGSAATLITERLMKAKVAPPESTALALGAAIVSNTLEFAAPSSTSRDEAAFAWLQGRASFSREFIDGMFKARSDMSDVATIDVLKSDYKRFDFGRTSVGISQLETCDLESVIERRDLVRCVDEMRAVKGVDHFFFSGVDIRRKVTVVVATRPETVQLLRESLLVGFTGGSARFDRILLRKTDLVPGLRKVLEP